MIIYSSKLFASQGYTVITTDISLNFKRDNSDYKTSLESMAKYIANTVDNIITVRQVHGIEIADSESVNQDTQADGIFTSNPHHCLAIKTADCVPLVLLDPKTKTTMILHCGRKGLREGIVQKGLEQMSKTCNLSDLLAYIGPNLGKDHHLVFEEKLNGFDSKYYTLLPLGTHIIDNQYLYDQYLLKFPDAKDKLKTKHSAYLDIPLYLTDLLVNFGVRIENIDNPNIDSFTELNTHSYRRDAPNNGLSLTLIGLPQASQNPTIESAKKVTIALSKQ